MIFTELKGDDLGVYHDDNYQIVECLNGHIVFSYAKKGKAMTAHIASDKIGLRYVKPAINSFCEWIFNVYDWCEMIFAVMDKELKSMTRIVKKCGFNYLTDNHEHTVYARLRQ